MMVSVPERLAALESKFENMRGDMTHVEAGLEDANRTLRDIAGHIRDQATERKLLSKLAHVIGWIIAAAIGWFSHTHVPSAH